MKKLYDTKEVLASWKRCMEGGTIHYAKSPALCMKADDLAQRRKKNQKLISVFEHHMELIKDWIPEQTSFLLIDDCGILIKKNKHK